MKYIVGVLFALLFHTSLIAQTYNGNTGSIPGTSTNQTCFTANVTGLGIINNTNGLSSVCINITHPNLDELEIILTAPDGTSVPLSIQNGGSGNNYNNTCFTATATTPIKFGSAPFTGNYLPEGHLGTVNNGQNGNGAWRLCIQDRRTNSNAGTLNSWSLNFTNNPAPPPPALPTCTNTLPSTSSCSTATAVCDFNGLCGSTSGSTTQDWTGSGLDACFGLQNNSFIRFVASSSTASFSVWVPNSTAPAFNNGGIQMLFFSGTCNSGPVTTYGCYPHIFPYGANGVPIITVVSASGLTPGNTYYLMIDGFNNDNCNFTIAANSGVNILDINPAAPSICSGQSVNLTASGGNGGYTWSPASGLSSTTGATVSASPGTTSTYTVTSSTATGCPISKDVTVTVTPALAAPAGTVLVQPNCTVTTGTISVIAPLGPTFEYSIDAVNYQSSILFTNLAPGDYNLTVRSGGCTSTALFLTVNAIPNTPTTPSAIVSIQPTCTTPTGTINITAPLGANLEYSINGTTYQSATNFTGVAPGNYSITVRNTTTGCVSVASNLTVNAIPNTPTTPSASVTVQPTCTTPTATIIITAPLGANLEYSINGTTYQTGTSFTGVTSGNYPVTVRNTTTGCISLANTLTVNTTPTTPAAPTASVTIQPTCTIPIGTISITAPLGANFEYSINGTTYQAGTSFVGLSPGNYPVTVRNTTTGCVSLTNIVTVNPIPAAPAAPTATIIVQPTCAVPTGTLQINTPIGSNFEYSINGTTYQTSTNFPTLAPGNYPVTVRNTTNGCIGTATAITVNPAPGAPAPPTASVTVTPTCTNNTGTITVSAPIGTNFEYSVNGTNYQSNPTFVALTPGNYNVTVRNSNDGCTSAATLVNIATGPTTPPAPTTMITAQPTCSQPSGSFQITAPVGPNLTYSIDGITYQTNSNFNALPPGTYAVSVRDINTTCVSTAASVIINPIPSGPAVPTLTTVQPSCTNRVGSVAVTAPIGSSFSYSIDGTNFQTVPLFLNLSQGNYSIIVRDANTGCTSSPARISINAAPTTVTEPFASVTQTPNCSNPTGTIQVNSPLGTAFAYSINGIDFQNVTQFSNVATGRYNITVRNNSSGCTATSLPVVINGVNYDTCTSLDIYFPTAFTPNGDGLNDGFGAGPNTVLSAVSAYTLQVYNRYGELVFKTNDPAEKWSGLYKGAMLGNYSYTWIANYRIAGSSSRTKKGTILLIR